MSGPEEGSRLTHDSAIVEAIALAVGNAARAELDAMRAEHVAALDARDAIALHAAVGRALDMLMRAATALNSTSEGASGASAVPGCAPYVVGEIYKAGALVTLPRTHPNGWAMAVARVDTYDIPGDPDADTWEPVLFHVARAPGFQFRGTHRPGRYAQGDIVLSPGGSLWIRTAPGDSDRVPGADWALFLKRGATGGRGRPGRDAPCIEALSMEQGQLIVRMTDGSVRECALPAEWLAAMGHFSRPERGQ